MSLNATTTISPVTPDKQLRAAYLVSSSPHSIPSGNRGRSRSPGNAQHLSTLDPRQNTPMFDSNSSYTGTESVNGDSEWSSAVGRATVAGKSGRVIERLMSDVDKLKRELNVAQARVEEEQLRGASARETLDSLRATKENLEAICETNRTVIARRDRKIEELKSELDAERGRRVEAEKERSDLSVSFENLKTDTEKEVYRATEIAARTQAEYDTCRKSLQRMKADWERQLEQMRRELEVVQGDRDRERVHTKTMLSISRELQGKQLESDRAAVRAFKEFTDYKKLMDESVKGMRETVQDGDEANQQLYEEMKETLGLMKWVVNVRKNVPSIKQIDEHDSGGGGSADRSA